MPDIESPESPAVLRTRAEDEVVQFCSELIRFESVNTGDPDTIGDGEAQAARYIEHKLREVGYETTYIESAPGRGNVICRLEGADRTRGSLLIHGHVDVVPADASEWTVDPFSGAVQDGYVWGRGAVDMKDMVAMTLAVAREFKSNGYVPPRDIIFAFVSDEEAGGSWGAQWLVDFYPELFADATEAISEVGGFSITLDDARRAYLVAAAEKGVAWAHLKATGRAGHGSMMNDDNAVTRIANAVSRLGSHQFPLTMTATVRSFLEKMTELTGMEFPDDDLAGSIAKIGPVSRIVNATLRNTATPTMLKAGYKANVIPSTAEATVDCRVLPGSEDHFQEQIAEIVGDGIEITWTWQPPLEVPFSGPLVEAMKAALISEDVGAVAVPYMLSGGTDNKAFARLGIAGYGFSPLRLPPELDFAALFHGVDERVPVESLKFGTRVLDRLLRTC
ncbi:M20/M25/M40 family metallo-hydrolase [Nakamurella sp. PAMC28650]|uniref:M20/M25/M40 family metallo-hydrolase n=1 Tax=Nakamurella sp. PAMC28650 TaxID=2762325 RepID=UPI00164DF05D|nr:M20/M25/M40 family metallo-hydrolase [Nakamurella sp. PAMC28650]QNK79908.1 M20/M25/M40 family metallo-hydrolase [Nakamurella sp. PAMC28650]